MRVTPGGAAEADVARTRRAEVVAELAALEDPRVPAVNERHGDAHGVDLGELRAVAKRLRVQHDLARQLWATGDAAARRELTAGRLVEALEATRSDTSMTRRATGIGEPVRAEGGAHRAVDLLVDLTTSRTPRPA